LLASSRSSLALSNGYLPISCRYILTGSSMASCSVSSISSPASGFSSSSGFSHSSEKTAGASISLKRSSFSTRGIIGVSALAQRSCGTSKSLGTVFTGIGCSLITGLAVLPPPFAACVTAFLPFAGGVFFLPSFTACVIALLPFTVGDVFTPPFSGNAVSFRVRSVLFDI